MTSTIITDPPTDTEWADHCRWAVPPVGTRRQMWIEREASALARRDGAPFVWPASCYYAQADKVIPS